MYRPLSNELLKRNIKIYVAAKNRKPKESFSDIGEKFGITRQRVHFIYHAINKKIETGKFSLTKFYQIKK